MAVSLEVFRYASVNDAEHAPSSINNSHNKSGSRDRSKRTVKVRSAAAVSVEAPAEVDSPPLGMNSAPADAREKQEEVPLATWGHHLYPRGAVVVVVGLAVRTDRRVGAAMESDRPGTTSPIANRRIARSHSHGRRLLAVQAERAEGSTAHTARMVAFVMVMFKILWIWLTREALQYRTDVRY